MLLAFLARFGCRQRGTQAVAHLRQRFGVLFGQQHLRVQQRLAQRARAQGFDRVPAIASERVVHVLQMDQGLLVGMVVLPQQAHAQLFAHGFDRRDGQLARQASVDQHDVPLQAAALQREGAHQQAAQPASRTQRTARDATLMTGLRTLILKLALV